MLILNSISKFTIDKRIQGILRLGTEVTEKYFGDGSSLQQDKGFRERSSFGVNKSSKDELIVDPL